MLRFCQEEDGFAALRRMAAVDSVPLHSIAASLVWHSLHDVFCGTSARVFPLLGRLPKRATTPTSRLWDLCTKRSSAGCPRALDKRLRQQDHTSFFRWSSITAKCSASIPLDKEPDGLVDRVGAYRVQSTDALTRPGWESATQRMSLALQEAAEVSGSSGATNFGIQ